MGDGRPRLGPVRGVRGQNDHVDKEGGRPRRGEDDVG